MGSKYTVKVWGRHFGESEYSWLQVWGGQSLLRGAWELLKARRLGFGCTTLECR